MNTTTGSSPKSPGVRSSQTLIAVLSIAQVVAFFWGALEGFKVAVSPTQEVPTHWTASLDEVPPEKIGIVGRDGAAVFVYEEDGDATVSCSMDCLFYPAGVPADPDAAIAESPTPPRYDIPAVEQVTVPFGQRILWVLTGFVLPAGLIVYALHLLVALLRRVSRDAAVFHADSVRTFRVLRTTAIVYGMAGLAGAFLAPHSSTGARATFNFLPFVAAALFTVLAHVWQAGAALRAEADGVV